MTKIIIHITGKKQRKQQKNTQRFKGNRANNFCNYEFKKKYKEIIKNKCDNLMPKLTLKKTLTISF